MEKQRPSLPPRKSDSLWWAKKTPLSITYDISLGLRLFIVVVTGISRLVNKWSELSVFNSLDCVSCYIIAATLIYFLVFQKATTFTVFIEKKKKKTQTKNLTKPQPTNQTKNKHKTPPEHNTEACQRSASSSKLKRDIEILSL